MGSASPLLSFLLMIVSAWVHRHQLIVIEFLQAENRLLKERLRGKRILSEANSYSGRNQCVKQTSTMRLPSILVKGSRRGR